MLNVIIYILFNINFLIMKVKFNFLKLFLKLKNYILYILYFILVRCLYFYLNFAIGV